MTNLDKTGEVECSDPTKPCICHSRRWDYLDAFTQGYIEALFADFDPEPLPGVRLAPGPFGFSDLAPETLGRIIADCEANLSGRIQPKANDRHDRRGGGWFWQDRQKGRWPTMFPPLTVQLGDDGKVVFSERG